MNFSHGRGEALLGRQRSAKERTTSNKTRLTLLHTLIPMKSILAKRQLLPVLAGALVALPAVSSAVIIDISSAFGTVAPDTRGGPNSTTAQWDTWADPGGASGVITNRAAEVGSGFWTTNNGEDHISNSLNFYSGSGSVNETITFGTTGVVGEGFTTIILQGQTLFGDFGTTLGFTPIAGITPGVVQGPNAAGGAQFLARYEIPGNAAEYSVNMVTGPFSFVSFGNFEVDTYWSETGFSSDTAVIPEPTSGILVLSAAGLFALRRRRK